MKRLHLYSLIFTLLLPNMAYAKKVLKYSESGSPTTLDPTQSATTYSNLLVTSIYDTLYEYKYLKVPFELKPNAAEAMPKVSKDGLTYTIKLKKGLFFTDNAAFPQGKGRQLTAHDFIYSIKRHFDPKSRSQGSWLWRGRIQGLDDWKASGADYTKEVAGLRALNDHTIQVKLIKPFPQIIYTFAMGFSAIVPKEAVEKYGKELSVNPVGSGPFILKSFSPQLAVLTKNPKYRTEIFDLEAEGYDKSVHSAYNLQQLDGKKLPLVDEIEVHFIKQSIARWNSFTKGSEIQFSSVPTEMVDTVLASKTPVKLQKEFADKYFLRSTPEFGFVYSSFNMARPEFGYAKDPKENEKNRSLRCAIRKAFHWRQRIERFYFGIGEPFPGIIMPSLASYSPLGDESIRQDLKGAKKLLKDAGWTSQNLPTFTYSGVASIRTKQFFEQFRGFLKRIGYPRRKIKFKQYATFGDYNRAMKESELPFISLAWGLDYPDAENLMQLFYSPNGSPGSNNSNYNNPEFDKLYEQTSTMLPGPERKALYKKMNEILIDDCVLISGFSRMDILLWHKNIIMYPNRSPHGTQFKYYDVL